MNKRYQNAYDKIIKCKILKVVTKNQQIRQFGKFSLALQITQNMMHGLEKNILINEKRCWYFPDRKSSQQTTISIDGQKPI